MKHDSSLWREPRLTAIRPEGWLREMLDRQRLGLTGNLHVAGYPFTTHGWCRDHIPLGDRGGTGWWPFEQMAYWVDGQIRCGILLDDPGLKKNARRQIDHVLNRPDKDGYLGPKALKSLQGERGSERWPHTVFFRAVMADHDDRPSKTTLDRMIRHYLSDTADHHATRNVCNIEVMAWLYEQCGDERMKDLAERSYAAFQIHEAKSGSTLANMLSSRRARDHGPTYMELFKLGAVMYRITGKTRYLKASLNAQRKLERDHVLIDGVPSATEHLRGVYSEAGHETCVITDYLWSLGILLAATGDAKFADAMERVAFNALPGATTEDFKALQYFSGPNQVAAGPHTNHHPHGKGCAHVSYRPNPATECCPGNVHRALPAYIGRMWLEDPRGGVIAALYGPSRYRFEREGRVMRIVQDTTYPFGETIDFRFEGAAPMSFRFGFRIPGWCRKAKVLINGKPWPGKVARGEYVVMRRTFRDGDRISLTLPRTLRVVKGPEDGVGVTYGPLVLSLNIREQRSIESEDPRSTPDFPAWTLHPAGPWNVGLALRPGQTLNGAVIEVKAVNGNPWDALQTPLHVHLPARRIPGWRLIRKKKLVMKWGDQVRVREGNILLMPPLPDQATRANARPEEIRVQLVPYGATRLRVTWFPRLPRPI